LFSSLAEKKVIDPRAELLDYSGGHHMLAAVTAVLEDHASPGKARAHHR